VIVITSLLVVIFDQLAKILLSRVLALNESVPVVRNIFHLSLIHNTGIAFGALKGNSRIILAVTIVGLSLIIYSLKKDLLMEKHALSVKTVLIRKMAVGFILGGAIGNMIDRLRLGYVVDFLDFRVWPVFNLADSFITIGAVILFWNLFISERLVKR
jgi:signal peptidase II